MSLSKSVPEGLNPRKCKSTKLREPLPVPYIPEKDKVQEDVAKLREKDTTLNLAVWQENGTREAFLMHVTALLNAMKKRGHFSNYYKAQKAHKEAAKAAKSAEAGLALLEGTSEESSATCARSMGARIPRTTHISAVGLRRTEKRSLISMPLRKAVRKVVP